MIGGNNNVTELYNFENETWSMGGDYPTAVRYNSVFFYNGNFYCLGGMRPSDGAYLSTVAKYVDGRWEVLPSGLNFARTKPGTLVINDSLWVIGGFGDFPLEVCDYTEEGVDCKDKGNSYSSAPMAFLVDENFCKP